MFDGRAMGTVLPASNIDELSVVEELSHQFVRRLSAPDTHQVDTDEGDIGMYDKEGHDVKSLKCQPAWLMGGDDTREEPGAMLNGLPALALCGFGQFSAALVAGVYNNERRTTHLGRGMADRDRLWCEGVQVHIGSSISYEAAAIPRGAISPGNLDDRTFSVSDFLPPMPRMPYAQSQPDGGRMSR